MSFLRHLEIYPSDGYATRVNRVPAHRLDEFPAGYSSAGCSPAEPASASPTEDHFALWAIRSTILFQRTVNRVLTVCVTPGGRRNNTTTSPAYSISAPLSGSSGQSFLNNLYTTPNPTSSSKVSSVITHITTTTASTMPRCLRVRARKPRPPSSCQTGI